jgi:hypothetical protein
MHFRQDIRTPTKPLECTNHPKPQPYNTVVGGSAYARALQATAAAAAQPHAPPRAAVATHKPHHKHRTVLRWVLVLSHLGAQGRHPLAQCLAAVVVLIVCKRRLEPCIVRSTRVTVAQCLWGGARCRAAAAADAPLAHAVLCAACACVYTHTNIRRGFSQLLACCVLLLLLCCSAAAAMQLCHMMGVHSLALQLQRCGWAKEEARRQTALQLGNAIGNVTVALHSITSYASFNRIQMSWPSSPR